MKKIIALSVFLLLSVSILTACGDTKKSNDNPNKINVYTTVYPLIYFTEAIGKDFVNVTSVYPPGVDEHTFEPSQKDIINIADSDLFFYIGYGLEGFAEKAEKSLAKEHVDLLAIGEMIDVEANHKEDDDHDEHEHGDINPHLWLDFDYAKQMATNIKDTLSTKDPKHKDKFEENYQQLIDRMDELDQKYSKTISSATKDQFLVSHAAFGYWEERYGIEQISVSGLSTTNEPSQKQLENLVKTAKKSHLQYILIEQNISSKLPEIIQHEAGLKSLPVHNLAVLTEQNIKDKEDYFTLMTQNLNSLKKALNE